MAKAKEKSKVRAAARPVGQPGVQDRAAPEGGRVRADGGVEVRARRRRGPGPDGTARPPRQPKREPDPGSFPARLKAARVAAGYPRVVDAARALGLEWANYARYESPPGRKGRICEPTWSTVETMIRVLGLPLEVLLGETPVRNAAARLAGKPRETGS